MRASSPTFQITCRRRKKAFTERRRLGRKTETECAIGRRVPGSFCQLQNLDSCPSLSPPPPPPPPRSFVPKEGEREGEREEGRMRERRALVCRGLSRSLTDWTGKPRRWTKLLSDNLGRSSGSGRDWPFRGTLVPSPRRPRVGGIDLEPHLDRLGKFKQTISFIICAEDARRQVQVYFGIM